MTAKTPKKISQTTINNLQSSNSTLVQKTINQLRETGNAAYIPALIELLHTTNNSEIKSEVIRLLSEIKHNDAIPLLIEAIENGKYLEERRLLVSACWENGLNYSNYLSLFIDLVIEGDFMVAFDAHTVIMNMSGKISQEIADKETLKLKTALEIMANDKKQLLLDLIDFLPVFQQGIEPQSF